MTVKSKKGWSNTERNIVFACIGVTAIILVVIGARILQTSANRSVEIEGLEEFAVLTAQHVDTPVDYPQDPPAGGSHWPAWQNCGMYYDPIVSEYGVHSLEHGAVWITYRPNLAPDQLQKLADIANGGTHRLVSPYPQLDSPIVISAWGLQLRVDSTDDPRLMQFVLKYEKGEQTPEPGAVCSGAIGQTARELGQG